MHAEAFAGLAAAQGQRLTVHGVRRGLEGLLLAEWARSLTPERAIEPRDQPDRRRGCQPAAV